MPEYLLYMSVWFILIALVAAINLRFALPGLLAYLGLWTPQARL
jgi:hypothetical protein